MRRFVCWLRKCKKGFTLMECICALAVVGIFSAMMLPLLSTAMSSFRVSNTIRSTATAAAKKNATTKTETANQTTLYVTIEYSGINASAESAFLFTESTVAGQYDVVVTYYDLKYGNEEK